MIIHDCVKYKNIILNKYSCPYCKAPAGTPCTSKGNVPIVNDFHAKRKNLATQADRDAAIVVV